MKKLLSICFILLFSFCSKKERHYPRITVPERKNPIEVNTKTMLHASTDNIGRFFMANFDHDTLIPKWKRMKDEGEKYRGFKWDTLFPRYDFKIIIDTSYTIAAKGYEYKNIDFEPNKGPDFEKVFDLWDDYVVSYPLLIYNNGKKPAYSNQRFRLIQEAKDADGKWKPIEFFANAPSCSPYYGFYEYLPKKYSGFSIIKYHGDFKTKLRVKVRMGNLTYYSNEINGNINRTQFNKETAREVLKFYGQFSIMTITEQRLQYYFLKDKPYWAGN